MKINSDKDGSFAWTKIEGRLYDEWANCYKRKKVTDKLLELFNKASNEAKEMFRKVVYHSIRNKIGDLSIDKEIYRLIRGV
jgi:hypothetical protein